MGAVPRWTRALKIYRINYKLNVLYVQTGHVSGPTGSVVLVKDCYLWGRRKTRLHEKVPLDVKEEFDECIMPFDKQIL